MRTRGIIRLTLLFLCGLGIALPVPEMHGSGAGGAAGPAAGSRRIPAEAVRTPVIAYHPDVYDAAVPPPPPEDDREYVSPVLGALFVLIPAGTVTIGSPEDEPGRFDNETGHPVTISRAFYLQATEVTQGQWKRVMGSNPSHFRTCGDNCPVEQVSWTDVGEFIRRLNRMEGTDKYGLPTEAQWEYAARAGTAKRFHAGDGDEDLSRAGWWSENSGFETHPVGRKEPNAWGLYDMHGNVWEWVRDWYGPYPSSRVTDPEGPASGDYRVMRGGSWSSSAGFCRSAFRVSGDPAGRVSALGFRLLRRP
jgi:formylglycine-generating enzyme required for sulfatase activity